MYLSFHRLGDHPGRLLALLQTGRPVAVVAQRPGRRPSRDPHSRVRDELVMPGHLGLAAEELDLREYFADREPLADTLASYQLVWLRGGNVFVLRAAQAQSGADHLLVELLGRDALVWAGYSAGSGAHLGGPGPADLRHRPPLPVPAPQAEAAQQLVARYRAQGMAFQALRDGQAIVIDAAGSARLTDYTTS